MLFQALKGEWSNHEANRGNLQGGGESDGNLG